MPSVRIKRGTRAALDALATVGSLAAGEEYLITDESRIAVGLTPNTYQAMAKQGEGGAGSQQVFVQAERPSGNGPWTWWKILNGVIVDLIVADGNP